MHLANWLTGTEDGGQKHKSMLGDSVYAEDIGQEVFIKLYNSLTDFRGESKLSTYIQKIAVNLTLNEIKRRKGSFQCFIQTGDDEFTNLKLQITVMREEGGKRDSTKGLMGLET